MLTPRRDEHNTDHGFRDNSLQNSKAPGVFETRVVRKQIHLPAASTGTAGYDILTTLLILKQPIKNEGSPYLSTTQTLQSSLHQELQSHLKSQSKGCSIPWFAATSSSSSSMTGHCPPPRASRAMHAQHTNT